MQIPVFAHIAAFSFFIPASLGIFYWKSQFLELKVFALFNLYAVVHLIAQFILGRIGISNQFLINFYWLIQFVCFIYIYAKRVEKNIHKDFLHGIGMLYFLFWMFDASFNPFPKEFNEFIMVSGNILLIVASVFMFYQVFSKAEKKITEYSIFWIGVGIIIYCSGTVIVFTMSNKILAMGLNYFIILWHINWGLTIVANILFARSFTCKIF